MSIQFAVQLYTLREECNKDFIGTLEQVKALGYKGVEFAGFFDTDACVLKEKLEELNLYPVASHIGIEDLENNFDALVKYHQVIGCKCLVIPWSKFETIGEAEYLAQRMIKISKQLKAYEMKLLYHNHDHEFNKIDGMYGLDVLFNKTEDYVEAEIDTHWVQRAGIDPLSYMNDLGQKVELIHIKDMKMNEDGSYDFDAIGYGLMDIKSIVLKAKDIGVEWMIVENDAPVPNGMENITKSITYIKKEMSDL